MLRSPVDDSGPTQRDRVAAGEVLQQYVCNLEKAVSAMTLLITRLAKDAESDRDFFEYEVISYYVT